MLLSDRDIWAAIEGGELRFSPELDLVQVTAASIDLHLDKLAKKLKSPPRGYETIRLSQASANELIEFASDQVDLSSGEFCLDPGDSLIGYTAETITLAPTLGARVEGRSSFARLGLSVHNTAPTIQPGWSGQIALEFTNHGHYKLQLEPGILICQLLIERLSSPQGTAYRGDFQSQSSS